MITLCVALLARGTARLILALFCSRAEPRASTLARGTARFLALLARGTARFDALKLTGLTLFAYGAFLPSAAHAGPVEWFSSVALHPSDPQKIVVGYENGLGGLFVSSDGGHTFHLRNSQSVPVMPDTYFPRDDYTLLYAADALLVAGTAGLLTGDSDTCGLTQGPTLGSDVLEAMSGHPSDPDTAFVVSTKSKAARGGLFRRAKSGELSALGSDDSNQVRISGLKVVTRAQSSEQLRFVETGTRAGTGGAMASAFVRYSDDLAATWTEHKIPTTAPIVRLLAVDPLDPERLLVAGNFELSGDQDPADDVLLSRDGGNNFESYTKLILAARHTAFAPDGRFWLGDTRGGLYFATRLGEALTRVSELQIHCLAFDKSQSAVLVCQPYQIGRINPADNSYCQTFRIYEATAFPSCAGENLLADSKTKDQLCMSYCNATHYWYAPFCRQYDDAKAYCGLGTLRTEFSDVLPMVDDGTTRCAGFPLRYVSPAGDGSDAGVDSGSAVDAGVPSAPDAPAAQQDASAAPLAAGSDASDDTTKAPVSGKKGGCSVTPVASESPPLALWGLLLLICARLGLGRTLSRSRAEPGASTTFRSCAERVLCARKTARFDRASTRKLLLAAALLVSALACGDDSASRPDAGDSAEDAGDAPAANDTEVDTGPIACSASTPRKPTSIEASGANNKLRAKVVAADHEPARKYMNTWVIALSDTTDNPISDAVFSNQRTFMPVHGHDGMFLPVITEDASGAGRYEFAGLNFTMIGPWQVQFDVSSASGGSDRFVLDVCVGD